MVDKNKGKKRWVSKLDGSGVFDKLDSVAKKKLNIVEHQTTASVRLCNKRNPNARFGQIAEFLVVWDVDSDSVVHVVGGIVPSIRTAFVHQSSRLFARDVDGAPTTPRKLNKNEDSTVSYLELKYLEQHPSRTPEFRVLRGFPCSRKRKYPIIQIVGWDGGGNKTGRISRKQMFVEQEYHSIPAFDLPEDWYTKEILKFFGRFACGRPAPVNNLLRYKLYNTFAQGSETLTHGAFLRMFEMDQAFMPDSIPVKTLSTSTSRVELVKDSVRKEQGKERKPVDTSKHLSNGDLRELENNISGLTREETIEVLKCFEVKPDDRTHKGMLRRLITWSKLDATPAQQHALRAKVEECVAQFQV